MKKNMGTTDRIVRSLIAIILICLSWTRVITGTLEVIGLIVAAIFILTSFVSLCPIYSIFGLSTCSTEKHA